MSQIFIHPSVVFASMLTTALITGCGSSTTWDKEYTCAGQEQSSTAFVGDDPARAIQKSYPMSIDFHLRASNAMVRSALVTMDANKDGVLSFSAKDPAAWTRGQFDQPSGKLTVVEERSLPITGRTQLVRTTGQYVCK